MSISKFTAAMDLPSSSSNNMQLGENGSPEYTASGVKEARVALFFSLVRGLSKEQFRTLLKSVLDPVTSTNDSNEKSERAKVVADAFLLAFQTRNCRGGKGEKDLFYNFLFELSVDYPETVASIMPLIPHYGTYKDWFRIVDWVQQKEKKSGSLDEDKAHKSMVPIVDIIFRLAKDQLLKDREELHSTRQRDFTNSTKAPTPKLSLLAKWAPREKKQYDKQVKQLATLIFPKSQAPKRDYRKLLSELNSAINTVEIKMSSNRWHEIDFGSDVPSVSLMKHRKAFLNETVDGQPPLESEYESGNRHPDNTERVTCRKRLREALIEKDGKKVKGRQLFPHEILSKLVPYSWGKQTSQLEEEILTCQWKDIREGLKESMEAIKDIREGLSSPQEEEEEEQRLSLDLGKLVPLVDVSGSMTGTPMDVAIALGVLISELASPAFADRCLTFSECPRWVDLTSLTLKEKAEHIRGADWGMNTNFEAAIEKILDVAVSAKLKPDDIPDLIVFSDMQFDVASRSSTNGRNQNAWETHHDRIERRFKETGLRVCGEEWRAPHIIYWNLRGDTTGFPAQADRDGVTMLSGFSPSLMKLLLSGEPLEDFEDDMNGAGSDEEGNKKKRDPYATLRRSLDDTDYDKVRDVLYSSNEGILEFYERDESDEPDEPVMVERVNGNDDWEVVDS